MLFRNLFALCAALIVFIPTTNAFAAPGPDDPVVDSERDEYDFSWLDPDKKIYVVQNRKYQKAQRFEISTGFGVGMGESYRKQRQWNYRGTFFLSEHWGVSGFGFSNFNSENDDYSQLRMQGRVPIVRDTHNYIGGSLHWIPFYGKINLFNHVFYIDWQFEIGGGSVTTEIDLNRSANGSPVIEGSSHGAFHWGTGWKFFLSRHWGLKLDFLATYYSAPNGIIGTGTNNGQVAGSEVQNYDNYYTTLGLSFTF